MAKWAIHCFHSTTAIVVIVAEIEIVALVRCWTDRNAGAMVAKDNCYSSFDCWNVVDSVDFVVVAVAWHSWHLH